jgi:hypothetical protein
MDNKKYPKEKFGSETTLEINTETGASTAIRDDVYSGSVTRKLGITEDSIQINEEQEIVAKVFDLYKQMKSGIILGFSVDATKYHPKTFKISRMIVSVVKLA